MIGFTKAFSSKRYKTHYPGRIQLNTPDKRHKTKAYF